MVKGLLKKYGWKLLLLGGIGKLISLTLVVLVFGHWFGVLLPENSDKLIIYITPHTAIEERLSEIEKAVTKVNGHGDRLVRVMGWRGWENRIKPGKYIIGKKETVGDVAAKFARGERESVRVVVPAARDIEAIASAIALKIYADSSEIADILKIDSVRWQIIPNSYDMWWETDAKKAISRLKFESEKWWTADRISKAESKGLTSREAVILASIVQAETAKISEAKTVAGLYLNRLERGQPLQADPTLIFALEDKSIRRVLNVHKKVDSPYNTYKFAGLPPSTIQFPEPTYIEAVLNAEKHDYLYMCAEPGGTGKHIFTKRYRDHLKNARKYQRWLNQQRIFK